MMTIALVLATVLTMAGDAGHLRSTRRHEGIPSIEVSPASGRMWMTWYAGPTGGEDSNNYAILATSADQGATWKEVAYADPDGRGPRRAFDPEIWISPDGRLRWFWTERDVPLADETTVENSGCLASPEHDDLMMAVFDSADAEPHALPQARRIARGVMMTKPIVAADGAWLLPVANWSEPASSGIVRTDDGGASFSRIGGANLPAEVREYDEHNIYFATDGALVCWSRTKDGWRRGKSLDGGRSWGAMEKPAGLDHTPSRFAVRRLISGALLLVKHGRPDKNVGRKELTAYVSDDDGQTWKGGLVLDARAGVTYPDVVQTPDGTIYVAYDNGRLTAREILFSRLTEADVRAAKPVSEGCRLSVVASGNQACAAARTEARTWTAPDGGVFRYRWHEPSKTQPGTRYPLVILMHGAGERGTDNRAQLQWGANEILDWFATRGEEFFFVAGQVPATNRWVEVPWGHLAHALPGQPSVTMARQIAFLESLLKNPAVDRSRVYVTGVSMGGYGTWDILCRRPEWFAGAMPICGGGDSRQAWRARDVPIWVHHGDRDGVVPCQRSRDMTAALWACGGNVKYTEHPNVGHDVWIDVYGTRQNLDWLFSRVREL